MIPVSTVASSEQLELVKRTIGKDLTHDELALYLHMCANEWNVHPLSKMIFPIKYGGRMTFVSSIDFLRARAAATGEHAGTDDATLDNGAPVDLHPVSATVTVYRLVKGHRCAFTATARWKEYVPQNNALWLKMPSTMLSKCGEALALRKAFPAELAKLYAPEEMEQAKIERDITPPAPPPVEPVPPPSPASASSPPPVTITGSPDNLIPDVITAAGTAAQTHFKAWLKFAEAMKGQVGTATYYKILGAAGVEHANQVVIWKQQQFIAAQWLEAIPPIDRKSVEVMHGAMLRALGVAAGPILR